MTKLHECIDNYINGNLTTAKQQAKHLSGLDLADCLVEHYGRSHQSALATAEYLKGKRSFQSACNAEFAAKQTTVD